MTDWKLSLPEGLNCEGSRKIERMCVNPKCKEVSFTCSEVDCQACKSDEHESCLCVKLKGVTSQLNKRALKQRNFINSVSEIQDEFVSLLQQTRQPINERFYFGSLEDKYLLIINKLYKEKEFKFLRGKEAEEFWNRIKLLGSSASDSLFTSLLDHYRNTFKGFLKDIKDLKKNIFEAFSAEKELENKREQFEIDSAVLSPELPPAISQLTSFNENFGKCTEGFIKELREDQRSFLSSILGEEGRVQRVERLFRASEHGFSVKAFHEKCDNREDTLVLVRTQFGKTIGGYTHYPWTSHGSGEWVNNSGRRAFLFSLDMREKFVPQQDDQLIQRYSGYGPTFGGGADIAIYDGCNSNSKSYANFPYTYNRAGGNKLANNKDTYRMFSGGDTYYFRVQEYEVFRVWYS